MERAPPLYEQDELLVGEDADRRLRYHLAAIEEGLELPKRKIDGAELVERVPPVLVAEALPVRAEAGTYGASSSGTWPASQRDPVGWAIRAPEGSYAVRGGPNWTQ